MKKQTNIEEHPTMKMNKRLTYIIFTSVLLLFGFTATAQVTVGGSVYGGGNEAMVGGSCSVLINQGGATITEDVYGGGALAMVNTTDGTNPTSGKTTSVTLTQGTVNGSVYGGGLGKTTPENVPANVFGPVQVTVNGGTAGSVYGCNNVNGAPQSTVNVDIYGTDTPGSGYALGNVFGGGNAASYAGTPVVIVHNCDNSIGYVYGGGNAASVAATDVTIYGGNVIGNVFGGGNGTVSAANVTGNTLTKIYGGTILKVFGGSNSQGTIGGTITVNALSQTELGGTSCAMQVGELYGGGNQAASQAGSITIGCMNDGDMIDYVYGGSNDADVTGDIVLTMTGGRIGNLFGGNNTGHSINGNIIVTVNWNDGCSNNYLGNVYGGGNQAAYSGTPAVNIINGTVSGNVYGGGNKAGVAGSNVEMTGGVVLTGVYGGCNYSGTVTGSSLVKILGGTIGSTALLNATTPVVAQVFGGGLGEDTWVNGNVEVNIGTSPETQSDYPKIYGDVYGGSALGNVNDEATDKTTVNILNGTLVSNVVMEGGFPVYYGGNVFGGGLGKKEVPDDPDVEGDQSELAIEAKVYGTVTVNIGSCTPNGADPEQGDHTGNAYSGSATIQGNVYGCNNTNGSPQQNVTVNIYQTAHTHGVDEVDDAGYSIHNVFGGGNEADFRVDDKTTTVNVFGCDNTIERTFGGGNAAATNSVFTDIKGGRIHDVFGGGNGEVSAADIYGNITLGIHGGTIGQSYSISNQNGVVTGGASVVINNTGCGGVQVEDHFMGGNLATVYGNLYNEITCDEGMNVRNLYGGCKQADVVKYPSAGEVAAHHDDGTFPNYVIELYDANPTTYANVYAGTGGNVRLTVNGGTYENVYGGSQGTPERGANIEGDVELNIYGGTITKAIFGGSHIKGSIGGKIVVTVDYDPTNQCALDVSKADVYGGGNQADYTAPYVSGSSGPRQDYPVVNIKRATVNNVFGGGLEADVTGNPRVAIWKYAKVLGNVYGGGNQGEVTGNPKVIVNGEKAGKLE